MKITHALKTTFVLGLLTLIFYYPVFLGKLPIPLDTLLGLYHPYRDVVWNGYKEVPYKNFLITDPVRQQIPARFLALSQLRQGFFSQWNPYSFAGTPQSANIQSALFYPLNLLFIFFPFKVAWTLLIILSTFLALSFMYLYLRNQKISFLPAVLGGLSFAYSGFFIAWLEWGTLTHVLLWLPLLLLSIDNLCVKFSMKWFSIMIFAFLAQGLAGHLQISFYVTLFSLSYALFKWRSLRPNLTTLKKQWPKLLVLLVFTFAILSFQYLPLFKFINLSARSTDLVSWRDSAWFLPFEHLIQIVIPDFFGNPATLNYFGTWNYGEFISYIGFIPLIFALYALFAVKSASARFFKLSILIVLLLSLKNPISVIPFSLGIPFISAAQPSRLISLLVFCLAFLGASGLNEFLRASKYKKIWYILGGFFVLMVSQWFLTYYGHYFLDSDTAGKLATITRRNLFLPSLLLLVLTGLLISMRILKRDIFLTALILVTIFDLYRFGWKYVSFSPSFWFYPDTQTTKFLRKAQPPFRIMTTDRRLLPPNVSSMYGIEDVSGYDPLYLYSYAQLVQSWNTNGKEVLPGSFNRIITPQNYESFITDLLNVKYILSLTDIKSDKLKLVFQEGETRIYENTQVFPRIFFVENIGTAADDLSVVKEMFTLGGKVLRKNALTTSTIESIEFKELTDEDSIDILVYRPNQLSLKVNATTTRFLVRSDIYSPHWKVTIDGKKDKIFKTDLALQGVVIPAGMHIVKFYYNDLSL